MTTRLLMTADAVGGVWTYALALARALVPLGIQTTIATMGPAPRRDQIDEAAAVPGLEIITSSYALEWMDDPWDDLRSAGEWLLDLEADIRPSLVHLNGYAHGSLNWRAPLVLVGHSCVASWCEAVGSPIDRDWLARYCAVVANGIRAADCVAAPSSAMLDALQRHYGPIRHASVVYNGLDPQRYRAASKEPFVFTAGRLWDRAKNVEALRSIEKRLTWPLIVAEGRSSTDMIESLSHASIVALPARYEPFGLLALEAALSGCALVLGDIASLREIWGDAAVYVDPTDHARLLEAIERLIAEPARRAEYIERSMHRAGRYTSQRMANDYARIYRGHLNAATSLS